MNRKWILSATALFLFFWGCGDDGGGNGTGVSHSTKRVEVTIINVSDSVRALSSDTFATGPIEPGDSVSFQFTAPQGSRLSFATMFIESNDWFYAPDKEGIALYNEQGQPVSGDITDQVYLWDAGTELDEPVGTGPNQAPRQSGPDTGPDDPDSTIRRVTTQQYSADSVLQVTLENTGSDQFNLTIKVQQNAPTPVSPGAYAVFQGGSPLFTDGEVDADLGLEALAEDGNPAQLAEYVDTARSTATPLSPGVWVVTVQDTVLFQTGDTASQGIEVLAEDGDPAVLVDSLEEQDFMAQVFGTGPIEPGDSVSFTTDIRPGEKLYFATMFVQSNDLFFAPGENGILLWPEGDTLSTGVITDSVLIWNAGTEVDEPIGTGENQAPRQAAGDTGPDENGVVERVDAGLLSEPAGNFIRVIVTEVTE